MYREEDDTEDLYNILETYLMQVILFPSHSIQPPYHLLPFIVQYFYSTPFLIVSFPLSPPLFSLSHFLLGLFPSPPTVPILHMSYSQAENILSEIQKLRELIDQSESVILINLDSQRNIMLRLGLQLEMGMFSAAISGLIGMAFGMNLQSSLEEVCMC